MMTISKFKLLPFFLISSVLFGCKHEEEKLGTIYGTVTDYATGEPVGNANVRLNPRVSNLVKTRAIYLLILVQSLKPMLLEP